jgi:hypothetical protein
MFDLRELGLHGGQCAQRMAAPFPYLTFFLAGVRSQSELRIEASPPPRPAFPHLSLGGQPVPVGKGQPDPVGRGQPVPEARGQPDPEARGQPDPEARGPPDPVGRGQPDPEARGQSDPMGRGQPDPVGRGQPLPALTFPC